MGLDMNNETATTEADFGEFETAWCPGCGNHSILTAMKKALGSLNLKPFEILFVSGIGQAAKAPHYLKANVFNGLHGRALPAATGAKIANPELTVIVESGEGCNYGEGGNHFLAAMRRNIDVTLVVHNNHVYGLTKGQASPTSMTGFVTKTQPGGTVAEPFNPVAVAVVMKAGFVARGFSGKIDHLAGLISQGIEHKGFSLIDVLQPCVSFNRINTFGWFNQRCYEVGGEHDPEDRNAALRLAEEWGEKIPIGVIYTNHRPSFESHFPVLQRGPLASQPVRKEVLESLLHLYQ
ncbi:MAG: 2-oxoglutarate/2-oxoacid ferredoxin oxidoreductase subunit beta [Thermodesulfobacteriota bacterium]|nr:2-oxoglutarate/2-oxoacid ferredoxin oxidoreductase subunit beta [Thermodesulfobacteriota bacterium]